MKKRFKLLFGVLLTLALVLTFTATAWAAEPAHSKTVTPNGDGTYKIQLTVTGDADLPEQTQNTVNVLVVYDVSSSMTSNNAPGTNHSRADEAENVVHDFLQTLLEKHNSSPNITVNTALVTFAVTATAQNNGNWSVISDTFVNTFDDGVGEGGNNAYNLSYSGNGTNWQHALGVANTVLGNLGANSSYPTFVIMITDGAPTASGNTGQGNGGPINPAGATLQRLTPFYNAALQNARTVQSRANTDLYGIYAYGGTSNDLLDDLIYYAHTTGDGRTPAMGTNNSGIADYYFNASNTSQLQTAINTILDKIIAALGITSVSMSDGTTSDVAVGSKHYELLDIEAESDFEYFLTIPMVSSQFKDNKGNQVTVSRSSGTATFSWTESGTNKTAQFTLAEDDDNSNAKVKVKWTGGGTETNFYPAPPAAQKNGSSVDWNLSSLGVLLNEVTYIVEFDVWPSQTTLDLIAQVKNDASVYNELPQKVKDCLTADGDLKTNTTTNLTYDDNRPGATGGSTSFNEVDAQHADAVEQMAFTKEWENQVDGKTADQIQLKVMKDDGSEPEEWFTAPLSASSTPAWTASAYISIGILSYDEDSITSSNPYADVTVRTPGHDFYFAEPESDVLGHNWELHAPTVHPMLINGGEVVAGDDEGDEDEGDGDGEEGDSASETKKPSMLQKLEDDEITALTDALKAALDAGKTDGTYFKIGSNYYKKIDGTETALKAVNHRRSDLNLTKAPISGAPADALFTYQVAITQPAEAGATDTDIWFSIWDENDEFVMNHSEVPNDGQIPYITGAQPEVKDLDDDSHISNISYANGKYTYTYTPEGGTGSQYTVFAADNGTGHEYYTGYYHAANGTNGLTIKIEAGWNVRFTNVPTGTTYEFTESAMPEKFIFLSAAGKYQKYKDKQLDGDPVETGTAGTEADKDAPVISGEIEETNASYTMTFTNDYGEVDIEVEKVWSDSDNAFATRPDPQEITAQVKNGNTVVDSHVLNAENEWTYTFAGLPKYDDDGNTITYTVDEASTPTGYTKSVSGYTITNTLQTGSLTITKALAGDVSTTTTGAPTKVNVTVKSGENYVTAATADGVTTATGVSATESTIEVPVGNTGVTITGLPYGTYTVEEVASSAAVAGYTVETTAAQTATLSDTTKTATVAITNTYSKKTATATVNDSLTVTKKDGDNAVMSGVAFTLKDGNTEVASYSSDSSGKFTISTDSKVDSALATYVAQHLIPGTEQSPNTLPLTLTETVPNGYSTTTASYTVVISAWAKEELKEVTDPTTNETEKKFVTTTTYTITIDEDDELEVINTKKTKDARNYGKVTINKIDAETNEALNGAVFELSFGGKTVTATSDTVDGTAGVAAFDLADFEDQLKTQTGPSVTFKLHEKSAPAGYNAGADQNVTVTITKTDPTEATEVDGEYFFVTTYNYAPNSTDPIVVPNTPKDGTLDVDKTADPTSGVKAGDTITYTITVKNTGEVPVTGITVTDTKLPVEEPAFDLGPSETKVITYTYTVTEDDVKAGKVENVATATGKDPHGKEVTDEDDSTVTTEKKSDIRYVWLTYVSNGGTEYPKQDFPYYPPEYPAIEYTIDKEPIRPGYTFDGWYADSALTIPVTMVVMDQNRTVYAKWVKTETPGWLNDDDHYAYMIGYPDGTVQPGGNITRAEVAAIFFRLLREEVREEYLTSSNTFSDVAEGQWFNTSISTVADMGIVNGYPDGTFRPNANITRAEFATIAARFDQLTRGTGEHFTDIAGHWAEEYIERAAKKGWIAGYPDGTFRPERLITRAEAATLINRVLNRDPESPEDLLEGMIEWPDNADVNAWYYIDIQEASNTHDYERETKPTEKWTVLEENPDWTIYNH